MTFQHYTLYQDGEYLAHTASMKSLAQLVYAMKVNYPERIYTWKSEQYRDDANLTDEELSLLDLPF